MFCKNNKIKNNEKTNTIKGVTLLEVIVIIGIFGMLMAVVMFKFTSFNNNILLTNMAYEVALSIREAQFSGTAVKGYGNSNNFEINTGIHFTEGSGLYLLFLDKDKGDDYDNLEEIDTLTLQRSMVVSELIDCDGNTQDPLNIIFDRPNPEPILPSGVNKAQIRVSTPDLNNHRYVTINSVGAIDVSAVSCN